VAVAAACALLLASCLDIDLNPSAEPYGSLPYHMCSLMQSGFGGVSGAVAAVVIPRHPPGITGRLVSVSPEVAHSVRERHRLPAHAGGEEDTLYDVVVVGGGAAGLAAAWRVVEAGPPSLRCLVLELEEQPGGNSRGGSDSATGLSFPWGAHYLPVPSSTGPGAAVARLVENVLRRASPPVECDEQPWCRSQL
jgi:hypothetical protein